MSASPLPVRPTVEGEPRAGAVGGVAARVGRFRWAVCALLFAATTINYIDRQTTGVLAPTLQREFGWSEAQYAAITSYWTAAYAVGFLFVGRFIDRVGVRVGFAAAVVLWSLAAAAHGLAYSVLGFGVALPPTAPAPDGRQIFSTNCASCHQASGEGVEGTYPPLAGSEWVTGGEERSVRILLHGLNGPVDVAGETYSGAMPPWGGALSDAEIAAVTTYVRGSWGNKAAPIAPAMVARVRAASAARKAPWTAAELQAVAPAHN